MIGVCAFTLPGRNTGRNVCYPEYIHEILGHAGIACMREEPAGVPDLLKRCRVLVTVGEAQHGSEGRITDRIASWVASGGAWISIAGLCGRPDLFGAEPDTPAFRNWNGALASLGEGYVQVAGPTGQGHPCIAHLEKPLHFFNGLAVRPADGTVLADILDAHQRPTGRAAIIEKQSGQGFCILIAPDLTGTVIRIQQGTAITRDGISAPDGTAPVCDGMLKCEDGMVLDWIFDRSPVPSCPGLQAFLQPVADLWCEVVIRTVLYACTKATAACPILWYYPHNLTALAHMSNDSDGNAPSDAERLLEHLSQAGIQSTWCVQPPGYEPGLIRRIRDEGHELAMHYDAVDHAWGEGTFTSQRRQLEELFGGEAPVTNKNHVLRWEGDIELYEWCAANGIQLDQSKGSSKTGGAGYSFGRCHPFLPVRPDGSLIDVLELPVPTFDLGRFAPSELLEELMRASIARYGILHLLFHPWLITDSVVSATLLRSVADVKTQGLEWWTAKQINEWERARRQARWSVMAGRICLQTPSALPGATLLFLCADGADMGGKASPGLRELCCDLGGQPVEETRWGFQFEGFIADAPAGACWNFGKLVEEGVKVVL